MPILIGAITAFLMSLVVGASLFGTIGFALCGALAGMLGTLKIGATETFYWIMLLILVVLLALMFFGVGLPGFLVMIPVVMMVSRLVSVWGSGLVSRIQS